MTIQELDALGHDRPVIYRGVTVTFLYLSMRFEPTGPKTAKRHPMKAEIRFAGGGEKSVLPKYLSPVPVALLTVHPDGTVT